MSRSKYNTLMLPYYQSKTSECEILYCILKRADMGIWQFVAGGGEDGESTMETAKRENI